MDTVKSILRGHTVVTVDTTNYDVVVETIPSNPESTAAPRRTQTDTPEKYLSCDTSYLLKMYSDVLSSGKSGVMLKCSPFKLKTTNQHFVHVLPTDWSSHSVLTYIPTFHIICSLTHSLENNGQNRVSLVMNLVPFNGNPLVHQSETLTFAGIVDGQKVEEESMVAACAGSKLLKLFCNGRFALCRGVSNCKRIENTLKTHGLESESHNGVNFAMRSNRCRFAVIWEPKMENISCDECRRVQEQINLIQNIHMEEDNNDDDEFSEITDIIEEGSDFDKENTRTENHENVHKNLKCDLSKRRLSMLKGITVVDQKDLNTTQPKKTTEKNIGKIIVKSNGEEVDFEKLKTDYLRSKANERNQSLTKFNKEGRRGTTIQHPYETAQQKATKRANKLLDSKRQQEVEKIAAEKLGSHEKKCPICEHPFKDVNEFMTHLSKCNVLESSEDEELGNQDGIENVVVEAMHEGNEDPEAATEDPLNKSDTSLLIGNSKIKKKKKWRKGKYAMEPFTPDSSCNICCDTLKTEKFSPHMKLHEKRFNLDSSVTCPSCQEHINKRQLNPHFVQVHPNDGGCCTECLQIMPREQIRAHLSKDHASKPKNTEGQLCPMCGKRCYFTSDLELHLATHQLPCADPPQQEEVMCHQCGKVFSHRYKLKQHLTNIHNKTFRHSCPFCNKVFNLRHQLTKHLVTHSDVKPFKCRYCDYKNARKYRVVKHIQKTHQGEGTEEDMELLGGTAKTSEFVHNVFGI